MIDAYKSFWNRSFDFKGRSTRKDYWLAVLSNIIVFFFLALLAKLLSDQSTNLLFIYFTFSYVPSLSLSIRRLHDVGKSWHWIFIQLIPVIGGLWFIYLTVQPSKYIS